MRSYLFPVSILLMMVTMDLYAFRGLRHLLTAPSGHQLTFTLVYWGISLLMLAALVRTGLSFRRIRDPADSFGHMLVIGTFITLYFPKILFNMIQLASDLFLVTARILHGEGTAARYWILATGALLSLLLLVAFALGMIRGRTNLKVYRERVAIEGLPGAFRGLRIVQLSDLHLAGFYHQPVHIRRLVERVNELGPDLILFTGDMVNDLSEEMDPFIGILGELRAPLGKFAVLGNHDYGHYARWATNEEQTANLQHLKEKIGAAGFDLILNGHRSLSLEGESIQLVGVENWGKPPFPQYGDLQGAMQGTDPKRIRILMSHDPSHWDLQVRGKEQVALTLSGHTHAMQFGIETGRFRWSPSSWSYRHWAGLYRENGQYLYVNRGAGFIGYPGRVGIRPEITLLTLEGTDLPAAGPVVPGP